MATITHILSIVHFIFRNLILIIIVIREPTIKTKFSSQMNLFGENCP